MIDTREKRAAVAVLGQPWMGPSVTVNALKDAEWRQEVALTYPGIPAAAPSAFVAGVGLSGVSALSGTSGTPVVIGPPWWPPMRLRPIHVH